VIPDRRKRAYEKKNTKWISPVNTKTSKGCTKRRKNADKNEEADGRDKEYNTLRRMMFK